jgi:serine/threonine-protein kinase HipA
MTSKAKRPNEAYVWIWLPGATDPVVAGKLTSEDPALLFNYGRSYLARKNAISLYDAELPLKTGIIPPHEGLGMPGCIRDAAPDAWGRRVLLNRLLGAKGQAADAADLDELTCLLESGSDRIGALDFQRSPTEYIPRSPGGASLEELLLSAEKVEQGIPLSYELDQALLHGSSIGGARPKALIDSHNKRHIAKFSSRTDIYSLIKAEYIAMRLAARCGLNVASVQLTKSMNKDVLLIERFDRLYTEAGWQRRSMLSALTLLGLDEMMARYASYEDLAELIRHKFTNVSETLKELFSRLVFNVLCGNTDDHARNHSAFWDGSVLSLTPAYDICPQARSGNEASQAMLISGGNRMSRISSCLEAAHHFLLSREEALSIVGHQVSTIGENWYRICEEAELNETERELFWGRQFLNPFACYDLTDDALHIKHAASELRLWNI